VRNLTLLSIYRVPMPGGSQFDICASCGQPFRSCKCFNAPDTPQSVPTCTCSKHPLWDGYDGDCPIHGWFEPVAADYERMCEGERLL
jgi:hypothetical protein